MELTGMKGALSILIHANKSMCKAFGRIRNWPSSFACFIPKYVIYVRLGKQSHMKLYKHLISIKRLSWQVGVMSVTLAAVEYMQRNKNRNETYVEACFKTFRKQGNIIHKGNYRFFHYTALNHFFPSNMLSFQLIESDEHIVNLLLLLVLLTNGYQPH